MKSIHSPNCKFITVTLMARDIHGEGEIIYIEMLSDTQLTLILASMIRLLFFLSHSSSRWSFLNRTQNEIQLKRNIFFQVNSSIKVIQSDSRCFHLSFSSCVSLLYLCPSESYEYNCMKNRYLFSFTFFILHFFAHFCYSTYCLRGNRPSKSIFLFILLLFFILFCFIFFSCSLGTPLRSEYISTG